MILPINWFPIEEIITTIFALIAGSCCSICSGDKPNFRWIAERSSNTIATSAATSVPGIGTAAATATAEAVARLLTMDNYFLVLFIRTY